MRAAKKEPELAFQDPWGPGCRQQSEKRVIEIGMVNVLAKRETVGRRCEWTHGLRFLH